MATRQQAIAALKSLVQKGQPQITLETGGRSLIVQQGRGARRKLALFAAQASERGVQAR
ncbi:MAG: hypothetical protein AAF215_33620 [Cyanobacteria bacterium P01_A01_bin.123]